MDLAKASVDTSKGGSEEKDDYEQAFKGEDKILRKFVKRVERVLDQCVRWIPCFQFYIALDDSVIIN